MSNEVDVSEIEEQLREIEGRLREIKSAMDDLRERPHDHLVEPLFAGLGHAKEPRRSRLRAGRLALALFALAALVALVFWLVA